MSIERVDTYLVLWLKDGSTMRCCADEGTMLDAAMTAYLGVESWKETSDRDDRDRLVCIAHVSGARIHVLTSAISGWMSSSRETRERDTRIEAELEREKAAFSSAENPEQSQTVTDSWRSSATP